MAELEKSEEQKAFDGGDTQNHQPESSENSEKMLKPWMKNLGKEFYMDEELGQYDSLPDAVRALKSRPKAKAVPESYGETGKVEEAFKKAGITKEEADAISSAFSEREKEEKEKADKNKPELKDVLGEKYISVMEDYGKSVASFMDEDLKKKIDDKGFSNDPDFVTLLAKVGKEIGSATFRKPEMPPAKKSYADQMVENILRKNANT